MALWVAATDFRTFLASRVVGGLSEGNVQLATAMAADISDDKQRGATMALVGVCFSIAFTFGPALGAALANVSTVAANPFATAAGFSLFLILVETLYLYLYLPRRHYRLHAVMGQLMAALARRSLPSQWNTSVRTRISSSTSPISRSSSSSAGWSSRFPS